MKLRGLVGGSAEVIGDEATLEEAARAMIEAGTGSLAVIKGRDMVGIVTERDVVEAVGGGYDPADETVTEWMTEDPDTFSPDVDVEEAAAWLLQVGYRHLPVIEDDELLGVVSIRDILFAIVEGG
jgi:CBS domain-containing protein